MNLKEELQKIIEGDVFDDPESIKKYSKDASIYEVTPKLIVAPKNSRDIEAVVKFINNHPDLKLSITARSAGTDMSGGAIGEGIILDMTKYMNKLVSIGEDSAVVQPGMFYRDFEVETLKHNLLLPCYPASRELNTVGGMVGNNSAGEKTLAFGQTEHFVKSLKVILADGNEYTLKNLSLEELKKKAEQTDFEGQIYKQLSKLIIDNDNLIKEAQPKVSKNSTGYLLWKVWDGKNFNLAKLLTGSQGTLGVVTEIEFSLIKPKPFSKLLVIFLYNLDHLGDVVDKVLEYNPEAFESYDDQTIKFAARFWTEVLKVIKPHNILSLGFHFIPEILLTLRHGFPKLILMAEFTGETKEQVTEKAKTARDAIKPYHLQSRLTTDEDDEKKYWVIRRESFNLFRHHATKDRRTAPFIDDIIVPPQSLPEFLPKLQKLLDPYKKYLVYTIAGHVGNGNFHIIPLMDFSDSKHRQVITDLSKQVYDLVFSYHGSMSAEHNDGMVRGPYLEQMYGPKVFELFKEVKKTLDPKDVFNPHKKVEASFGYSNEHMVTHS